MVETAPRWLRAVWAEIGGLPPPRFQRNCESTVTSEMQVEASVHSALKEGEVASEVEVDSVPPEVGVAKEMPEPVVKSEVKEAIQRRELQGTEPVGQGKAKLAAGTEGGKWWYCRACGKSISCSNRAKHLKRIHPRAFLAKRGRPKGDGKRVRWKGTGLERDACEGVDVS